MGDFNITSLKKKVLRKYPAFGAILISVKYEIVDNSDDIKTAGTNGNIIKINKDFMNTLTENEQIFILAHEICHIAFEHIKRSKDKDPRLWNIATDAIINKNLEHDGLTIPKNGVNIADAMNYDAEELYELLLKEQKEKNQNSFDKNGKGGKDSNNSNNQNQNVGHDDHGMWNNENKQNENDTQNQKISEKEIFKDNRKKIDKQVQDIINQIKGQANNSSEESKLENVGNVGSAKNPVVNWRKLLIKELEMEDERWGRAYSKKNDTYCSKLKDWNHDEPLQTDIILDTSNSISVDLLKAFLRQMKVILRYTKIRVATFSSDFHYDWHEINCQEDIDNLQLYIGGGTNFDAASRAFTKDPNVNKICFTDGDDNGDALIMDKRKDIIWISFGNKYFKPDNGKVIYVNPDEFTKFIKNNDKDKELVL